MNPPTSRPTRLLLALLGALALTTAMGLAPVAAQAPAAAPVASAGPAVAAACQVTWGSLAKRAADHSTHPVSDVRSGRHTCFDRLVVDMGGDGEARPGFGVRYVARVTFDGSGAPVPLRGGARLRVIVNEPAYDEGGTPTYVPADPAELVDVAGNRTFRQVAWAGSFEGQTTVGLGVRARLPMRAFVLEGPGSTYRLVVDVAHTW